MYENNKPPDLSCSDFNKFNQSIPLTASKNFTFKLRKNVKN